MRAMIVTQHFAPEVTACRFRMESFAEALVRRGHEVDVVTAVPNHPTGIVEPGYRGRALVRRRSGPLSVNHVWVKAAPSKRLAVRLANYASFAAGALAAGAMLPRPDVILATSPPLPVATIGSMLARLHRAPWVMDVRDLWPKVLTALGEVQPGPIVAAAERVERAAYASASAVVTVTEPFRGHVRDRSPARSFVEVVTNGTTRAWLEVGERDPEPAALGVPSDRFVITYAGNLGYYHGLDVVVEAASLLDDGFQVRLIGHGPMLEQLQERAAELPAGRLEMLGLMEPQEAAMQMRASDALLVPVRGHLGDVLSSKVFDCCAVGRPLIVSAAGVTRQVVEEADAALTVQPEDPDAIAAGARRLRDEPGLGKRLGAAGRELARANLREEGARQVAELLEGVAAGR